MMHLITITGEHAENLFLKSGCISDFKALIRTVTSGRVLVISTKFRSDLFFSGEKHDTATILKLWSFYADSDFQTIDLTKVVTRAGDMEVLSYYFESLNILANHWYHYDVYKKAFRDIFYQDNENPIMKIIKQCDHHLLANYCLKRAPLVLPNIQATSVLCKDTFSLAMRLLNDDSHSN